MLSPSEEIEPESMGLTPTELAPAPSPSREQADQSATQPYPHMNLPYHQSMEEHSRMLILRALKQSGGNQTKAADQLHLQRTYLARLMRQKNLDKELPGES